MKLNKKIFFSALLAGIGSTFTIALLSFGTYETEIGFFLMASFGSSIVLIFGYPEGPFSQPKNIFFAHLLTSFIGVFFVNFFPINFITIGLAVGLGVMLMIIFKIIHPPAGGNSIIVMIGGVSYEFLLFPVVIGSIIIIFMGILYNRFLLKKKYPVNW